MRYTFIAAALVGAAIAMPAVPASYGSEAPAAYNAPDSYGSENVYGTEVSNKPTSAAAALPSSTCTDEAENVVPYTQLSQVASSSAPAAYGVPSKSEDESVPAKQTDVASSSEVSPGKPAETPAGYATKPAQSPAETPAGYASASKQTDVASSSESSPESPAQTPAGYQSKPADVASSTEVSPESPKETKPVESAPVGYAASSAVPKSPESTAPAEDTESSPEKPAQYGSTIVPGSAPTAAPYPQGGNEASPVSPPQGTAAASGVAGAPKPTGTGSVGGYEQFEGAASSLSVAGLFVSFGAIAALFM
ncbi:hypothetical protein Q7P35_006353 [Cladosporium inversicolor]